MSFIRARDLAMKPRLVVSVEGKSYTGKTHFALTAPKPMRCFNVDYGLEGMLQNMVAEEGFSLRGLEVADYSLSKAASLSAKTATDRAKAVAREFMADYQSFLKLSSRATGIFDTATELWQIFRLADLGKLKEVPPIRYDRVNLLFLDLLRGVMPTPHNLILIHRVGSVYQETVNPNTGKKVSVKVEGQVKREGFSKVDYVVQVEIHAYRKVDKKGRNRFGFTVGKCRQRPSLTGTVFEGEIASFPYLAMAVFPDSQPEDWE